MGCLGLNEPGILRRTSPVKLIKFVQEKYNTGLRINETNEDNFGFFHRSTSRLRTVQ